MQEFPRNDSAMVAFFRDMPRLDLRQALISTALRDTGTSGERLQILHMEKLVADHGGVWEATPRELFEAVTESVYAQLVEIASQEGLPGRES